jgi:hypothetical protein
LNKEYREWVDRRGCGSIYPENFPEAYKEAAINAMDENGKRMCLELLEYMLKNCVAVTLDENNNKCFLYKTEVVTKEQLFENFL